MTKINYLTTYPRDGSQFVAMWLYNNKPWASSYYIEEGVLYQYDPIEDEWKELLTPFEEYFKMDVDSHIFFIQLEKYTKIGI